MNNNKPHLIFVGFHPSSFASIDCDSYRVSIIVHRHVEEHLDISIKDKLIDIGVIHVAHNMNLEEYINAMPQIEKIVDELIKKHGLPKGFIALYEHVTLPAAILREKYNIPGTTTETTTLCRDKIKMKQAMLSSSIKCPTFMAIDSKTSLSKIQKFLSQITGKIVLKPRNQAASQGISIFNDAISLLNYHKKYGIEDSYEVEEYISGELCHFDGVIRNNSLLFFGAFYYTAACYDYVYNHIPMASISIDNSNFFKKAKNFSIEVLNAIGLINGVFHLEAFVKKDGGLVFLEVANRFGGAGVAPHIHKIYGVDLIKEAILSDIGEKSLIDEPVETINSNFSSAWLYIPIKTNEPCQVKDVNGLTTLPKEVIYSSTVKVGEYLNTAVSPFPYAGRFFIKARTSKNVEEICKIIIKNFNVRLKVVNSMGNTFEYPFIND